MISVVVGVLSDLWRGGRMTAYNVVRPAEDEPAEVVPVSLVDDVALLQADVVRLSRELAECRAEAAGWKEQLDAAIEARELAEAALADLCGGAA